MTKFSKEKGFKYEHFDSDVAKYSEAYKTKRLDVYSVNNFNVPIDENMRVSHFIRDPRDLMVSGYHYHKWTGEAWCNDESISYDHISHHHLFKKYIGGAELWPLGVSYQEFINKVTKKQGLILELIWRKSHFETMQSWDYSSSNVLLLKYEDVIDHEEEFFEILFNHYNFPKEWLSDFLKIVSKHSRKNARLSEKSHTRNGSAKQWASEFDDDIQAEFNSFYPTLLNKTGYE